MLQDGESKAHGDGSALIKVLGHVRVTAEARAQSLSKSIERLLNPRLLGLNGTIRGYMIQLLSPWKTTPESPASMGAVIV